MNFENMFKSTMSQDIAAFANNNLLFQTFINSTEPCQYRVRQRFTIGTGEGKIDRKVKTCEPRELCHSSKGN